MIPSQNHRRCTYQQVRIRLLTFLENGSALTLAKVSGAVRFLLLNFFHQFYARNVDRANLYFYPERDPVFGFNPNRESCSRRFPGVYWWSAGCYLGNRLANTGPSFA